MSFQSEPRLYILDVAHGNSAVLVDECEGGQRVIVVDAGRHDSIEDFLEEQGIKKIDVVLISHADTDHIEGLIGLITCGKFDIGVIRLNPDGTKNTQAFEHLATAIETTYAQGSVDYRPSLTVADDKYFDKGNLRIQVLAPGLKLATKGVGGRDGQGKKITSNSLSAVVKIIYNRKAIALLPGDIDQVGLNDLRRRGADIQAPILIFPHHGGLPDSGDTKRFVRQMCNLTQPQSIMFSIGRGSYDTPRPEVIAAVRSCSAARIACTQLSEHCAVTNQRLATSHLNSIFAKGRENRRCCAGSLSVNLIEGASSLKPYLTKHRNFIRKNTDSPLCQISTTNLSMITSVCEADGSKPITDEDTSD